MATLGMRSVNLGFKFQWWEFVKDISLKPESQKVFKLKAESQKEPQKNPSKNRYIDIWIHRYIDKKIYRYIDTYIHRYIDT